jgi:hypothetical protein
VRLADISETYNDAFAAVVRRGLRKAGVGSGVTVVFSDELAKPASLALTKQQYKKSYFGTSSYIPGLFGLYIASHVIRQTVEEGYRVPPVVMPGSSSSSSSKRQQGSSKRKSSRKGSGRSTSGDGVRQQQQQQEAAEAVQAQVSSSNSSSSSSSNYLQRVQQPQQQQQLQPMSAALLEPGSPPRQAAVSRPGAAAPSVLGSFDQAQGKGMGYDGEGI